MSIKWIVLGLPVLGAIAFASSVPAEDRGTDQAAAVQAGLPDASPAAMVADDATAALAGDTASASYPVVEPADAGDEFDDDDSPDVRQTP